mgnify:CR=1 FL=1
MLLVQQFVKTYPSPLMSFTGYPSVLDNYDWIRQGSDNMNSEVDILGQFLDVPSMLR